MSRSARSGAVLLAGGASTRMGEDKAWLRVGDATLLEHVVSVLLEAVDVVVVVGRPGQALPPLVATVERVDDHPALAGGGPLVGIAAGLARLDSIGVERAYLGSVDAPSLTVAHVAWMMRALDAGGEAALPELDGVHPLAGAVLVGPALAATEELLARARRSAQALYEALGTTRVRELPDPGVVRPCNTPEEWALALRGLGGRA